MSLKIAFLLGVIYLLIFAPFGLDFSDAGFLATLSTNIFRAPESVADYFVYWLTGVLGGTWYAILPIGLISFRIAYVVVLMLTAWGIQKCIKHFFKLPDTQAALIALVTLICCNYDIKGPLNWLSYNELSSLFYIWGIFFLGRGLCDSRQRDLGWAGLFFGLNIFIRLTNLAGLIFLSLPILANFIFKRKWKIAITQLGWLIGGILAGVLVCF
ncbi:MAG: hypothetical protein ACHQVK_03395, partial [Candidatus Paceibacterales bacterium]